MSANDSDIYKIAAARDCHVGLVAFYNSIIAPVYPATFPRDFRLAPSDWHLTSDVVHRNPIAYHGQMIRPIGTLDVEFLSNAIVARVRAGAATLMGRYPCGLKCPGCFSEDETYLDAEHLLTWEQVFSVVDDARDIGLTSLKFLGPGELFQNPDLFDILDAAEDRDLPLSIFTKGAELGDDQLAEQIYGYLGIRTARELVARIARYSCVRILLGFNSFHPRRQDSMTGSLGVTQNYRIHDHIFQNRGVKDYTAKRNRALINLCDVGFNAPESGQRLSLIAAPIGLDQIDEIPDMYVWAARRNMPLVIAPTMESGPKAIGLMKHNKKNDPSHERLREMYVEVYSRALDEKITTIDGIVLSGISAYMGTAPCNQVANGLFLRLNGKVQMCPGSLAAQTIFGSIHEGSIVDIWVNSSNQRLGPLDNNWCRAKTDGMPAQLQGEVLLQLQQKYDGNWQQQRDYDLLTGEPRAAYLPTSSS